MDRPLGDDTAPRGRGEAVTPEAATPENRLDSGKILSEKKGKISRSIPGCPEIVPPWQKTKYELQMSFFTARFLKMLEWARYHEKEGRERANTGHEVRAELQTFLGSGIDSLLALALRETDGEAKEWAGALLSNIRVKIEKHDKKLSQVNAAYCDEKKKIGKLRTDVLFPKPITSAVKRELKRAERYHRYLMFFKIGFDEEWKAAVSRHNEESRQKIPEAYWPFAELPEFSVRSEPRWWKLLWPLIKKNNPDLLATLREGKIATRGIRYHARWASYRKEFRNALRTLARWRAVRVL